MKIITKCFTFALMIALILSITAISAQEDISFNQSDLKSIDDDSIKISLENSQQTTNEMENEEVTDTEDGSYSDLVNEFKSYEGGQFTLSKKHYSYDSGNSIEINKNRCN